MSLIIRFDVGHRFGVIRIAHDYEAALISDGYLRDCWQTYPTVGVQGDSC